MFECMYLHLCFSKLNLAINICLFLLLFYNVMTQMYPNFVFKTYVSLTCEWVYSDHDLLSVIPDSK